MRYYATGSIYFYWEDKRGRWLCDTCRTRAVGPVRRHVGQWSAGREIPWCQVCRESFAIVDPPPSAVDNLRARLAKLLRRVARR